LAAVGPEKIPLQLGLTVVTEDGPADGRWLAARIVSHSSAGGCVVAPPSAQLVLHGLAEVAPEQPVRGIRTGDSALPRSGTRSTPAGAAGRGNTTIPDFRCDQEFSLSFGHPQFGTARPDQAHRLWAQLGMSFVAAPSRSAPASQTPPKGTGGGGGPLFSLGFFTFSGTQRGQRRWDALREGGRWRPWMG